MAICGTCPYLKNLKNGKVRCECATFSFPDKIARRQLLYGFCAHPSDYKKCGIKEIMDNYYYERKFKGEEK